MELQLAGKRALVCGGSSGIGRAVAVALAGEGAHVAIAARDENRLARAAAHIEATTSHKVITASFDTRIDASVREMVSSVAHQLGGLDILVNSAAPPGGGAYRWNELESEQFLADVNTKAMGYLRCAQEAAPYMIERGWGRIINVSGLNVRHSGSLMMALRNSAVAAITKNLADELGGSGVNVTLLHPGRTRTENSEENSEPPANTIGRVVEAEEVAAVVTFLASPRSVSISGDTVAAGGGVRGAIFY